MQLMISRQRQGYVFLVTVLMIGTIVVTTMVSLLLLGLGAGLSGLAVEQSTQALELAHTCAERAILSLRDDSAYAGNQTLTLGGGTCSIRSIGGSGNATRSLCVSGVVGRYTRNMEIIIQQILPTTKIRMYREVGTITLCQ